MNVTYKECKNAKGSKFFNNSLITMGLQRVEEKFHDDENYF